MRKLLGRPGQSRGVAAWWRSADDVGRINEVTLRRARLVPGWPSSFGQITSVCNQPHRPIQPPTLCRTGNEYQVPTSWVMLCGWGVKAGWLVPYVDKRVRGT